MRGDDNGQSVSLSCHTSTTADRLVECLCAAVNFGVLQNAAFEKTTVQLTAGAYRFQKIYG